MHIYEKYLATLFLSRWPIINCEVGELSLLLRSWFLLNLEMKAVEESCLITLFIDNMKTYIMAKLKVIYALDVFNCNRLLHGALQYNLKGSKFEDNTDTRRRA